MDVHAPPNAVSVAISFVGGVRRVCGVNLIAAIPGFVVRGKTGMVR